MNSSPELIYQIRLYIHFIAMILNYSSTSLHLFSWYQTLFLSISSFTIKINWFPTMVEDVLSMAVKALAGRWYKCANGHSYYVDKCGRPTQILKCITCGIDIGGLNHNLLKGQTDIDKNLMNNTKYHQKTQINDHSEAFYCLKAAKDENNAFDTVRSLSAISNRIIRLFMHIILSSNYLKSIDTNQLDQLVLKFMNKTYYQTNNTSSLCHYFLNHLKQDWKILKSLISLNDDDLSLILHNFIELHIKPDDKKII